MTDKAELTSKRFCTHGHFEDNARIAQTLKNYFRIEASKRAARGQKPLSYRQMDALDMFAAKISRIFAGDPDFADHWDDIAGYAHVAIHEAGENTDAHTNTEADRGTSGE